MDERALKALKDSIEVWRQRVEGAQIRFGTEFCPLCHEFNTGNEEISCAGCPVYERTEARFCRNTPYEDIEGMEETIPEMIKAEYDFLVSLLPENENE